MQQRDDIDPMKPRHAYIQSSYGLFAAILALAVSFTNLWVLPQKLSLHGGGAYLIILFISLLLFGLPFLVGELLLGRLIGKSVTGSLATGWVSALYSWFGRLCVLVALIIASIFSMVAGWGGAYLIRILGGELASNTEQDVAATWQYISSNTEVSLLWHTLLFCAVLLITARPVHKGLERYSVRLLLVLAVCVLLLVFLAAQYGDSSRALALMFAVNFDAVDSGVIIGILEHVFYSLGLGIGALMVLGKYSGVVIEAPKLTLATPQNEAIDTLTAEAQTAISAVVEHGAQPLKAVPSQSLRLPIVRIAALVAIADFLILCLLCFCILALVPANEHGVLSADFDLVFMDLPRALAHNSQGQLIGSLFYIILILAGVGSTAVLLEPFTDKLLKSFQISRLRAARLSAMSAWLIGLGSVFSFSLWRDAKISLSPQIGNKIYILFEQQTLYSMLSYVSFALLLPILGISLMYYVGFIAKRRDLAACLPHTPVWLFKLWYFLIRNVVPLIMLLIFLQASGLWDYMALRFS